MKVLDVAKDLTHGKIEFVGIRPGEKIQSKFGIEDAPYTYEYEDYYKVLPAIHEWNKDPARIKDG